MIDIVVVLTMLAVCFLALYCFDFDIMAPACIICEVLCVCFIFSIILNHSIGYVFTGYSLIYVVFACIVVILTSIMIKHFIKCLNLDCFKPNLGLINLKIPSSRFCVILTIVSIFIAVGYVYFQIETFDIGGFNFVAIAGAMYYKSSMLDGNYKLKLFGYMTLIIQTMSYIFAILYFENKINKSKQIKYINNTFYVISLLNVFLLLIKCSRIGFFSYIGSLGFIYYIIWHKHNGWRMILNKNMLLVVFATLFICFTLISSIKVIIGRGSEDTTLHYAGGGLTGLDYLLSHQLVFDSEKPRCFKRLQKSLGSLSSSFKSENIFNNEGNFFVNSYELGNVYTPIYIYWHDFGILGIFLLYSITSIFYSFIYFYMKRYKCNGIPLVVFAFFLPGLLLQGFDDYLINYLFPILGFAYISVSIVCVYVINHYSRFD